MLRPPPVDAHRDALYRELDAFINRVTAAGDRLLLTPLVVLGAVATLQHAAVFQLPAAEAAERVLRLAQAPEVVSKQRERVIAALSLQALSEGDSRAGQTVALRAGHGGPADGYLARLTPSTWYSPRSSPTFRCRGR